MGRLILLSSVFLFSMLLSSCCSTKKAEKEIPGQVSFVTSPEIIIYQTTKDYSKLVPVNLSDDKKQIESYPDIKDIFYDGKLAYPVQLHNGYWLDNRGIGRNVAFIKLTYEEYSKLSKTPSAEELMNMIIDDQPLISMYSCGARSSYKEIETELNMKIDSGDFSGFKKIK